MQMKGPMPTKICTLCNKETSFDDTKIGKQASKSQEFHAYCQSYGAYFSNSKKPEDRKIIWDQLATNIYPNGNDNVDRLENRIIVF